MPDIQCDVIVMNLVKRAIHRTMSYTIKAYQFCFMAVHVWGRENIPKGPKIFVTNHITSYDEFWVLPVFNEPVHIVIGPGYNGWMNTKILDWLEQINAMPAHRRTVVDKAVEYLNKGESIYMAPEGDAHELFQLGKFYPGVARIQRLSGAPIVPIALVMPKRSIWDIPFRPTIEGRTYQTLVTFRGPFCINVGEVMGPDRKDESDEHFVGQVRDRVAELCEDVRMNKYWQ